jgi:hypothetical protein
MSASPLLEIFKRGEAPRDIRLAAAQGALAPRALEQASILVLLLDDPDLEISQAAEQTIGRIRPDALSKFLARSDVPLALREFFATRGILPASAAGDDADDPLIDADPLNDAEAGDIVSTGEPAKTAGRESALQQLATMGIFQRLKAAMKGSREMRAILIRDPNKMISAAVMSSPKLTEQEVEGISRMANVSEEVLRTIGANRAWMKNYSIVLGLAKNPKTPLAMSMNIMHRLSERDLNHLSVDRNVPEALRIAARKKVLSSTSRG